MTFHEWKKKTFTWVDNDVARYMQRAWAASTKEQAKQKAKLKAENAKLQESNNAMAELLKEWQKKLNEQKKLHNNGEFRWTYYNNKAKEVTEVLTAAGQKTIKDMKEKVLAYLKSQNTGKRPTDIGLALGKDYNTASSSVSPALKQLTKDGIIKRQKVDGKITYQYKR